jgi:hypothetical protein
MWSLIPVQNLCEIDALLISKAKVVEITFIDEIQIKMRIGSS